jgi:hypothetical protein
LRCAIESPYKTKAPHSSWERAPFRLCLVSTNLINLLFQRQAFLSVSPALLEF